MTGLTDALRQNFKVMKDSNVYSRFIPEQRKLSMMKFMNRINQQKYKINCIFLLA